MPIISLKQDKGVYTPIEYHFGEDVDYDYDTRHYHTNEPIDCYHRLHLSADNLKLLLRIGKVYKKLQNKDTEDNEFEILREEYDKLTEKFGKTFYNPYRLDWEIQDNKVIEFIFSDYDYEYRIIRKATGGWYTNCYRSSVWSDGTACEVDKPSDGPSSICGDKF